MISQKITIEEVRRRVQCKQNIIQQIMDRKLNLFGHICRMKDNRLVKEVMFGTMEGKSRRGRPCREWFDDIKEWDGEEIHIAYSTEWRMITAREERWCGRHWTPTGAEPTYGAMEWMDLPCRLQVALPCNQRRTWWFHCTGLLWSSVEVLLWSTHHSGISC